MNTCKHNACHVTGFITMKCKDCGYTVTSPQNCWGLPLGTGLRRN